MRGFRFGFALSGALAAISLGMSNMFDFRAREVPLPKQPEPYKAPHAKRSGRQRSSSRIVARDRLVVDRSSSVRKMQRWLNSGDILLAEPRPSAINRHKVRRIEIQRAKNLAALAAG